MSRTLSILILAISVQVLAARPAVAGDLLVPSGYKTIQAALNAAKPSDRILVGPGVYHERIVFPGIPLFLVSTHGARDTVIDADYKGAAVTFDPRDGLWTMMTGFTVTGGLVEADDAHGGGVNFGSASPTFYENVVTGNWVHGLRSAHGAGLYATGNPIVLNNLISENIAAAKASTTDHAGAGVHAIGGVFVGNTILGNSLISNREVWEGVKVSRGGGVFAGGRSSFVFNRVIGNHACFYGRDASGGGFAVDGQAEVSLNIIRNNTARAPLARGGGIYCAPGSKPIISGNVIFENLAESEQKYACEGGGVFVDRSSAPQFTYNTVHANRVCGASVRGAGLSAVSAAPRIVGCIFWNNTHWDDHEDKKVLSLWGVSSSAVSYSIIGDGQFAGVNHNAKADPRFIDAYHLGPDSPCIDAGEPGTVSAQGPYDLEHTDRVRDGSGGAVPRIDIGALEYGPLTRWSRARVGPGDRVELDLFAPRLIGATYVAAASFGKTGIPLAPPDRRTIPLSPDHLFLVSLGQDTVPFEGFAGVIDAKGRGRLALTVPGSSQLLGLSIHVAGIVVKSGAIQLVTNAVTIGIWK